MFKLVLLFLTAKTKYYYDKRIHNFGNTGLGGQLHSKLAPYATKLIDDKCYNSVNIRQAILSSYYQEFKKYQFTFCTQSTQREKVRVYGIL